MSNETILRQGCGPGPVPDPEAPGLTLERFLPYRMSVLADGLSRALARHYQAAAGLSVAEWRVLVHLAAVDPAAPAVSVRDVEARVALDRVQVSRACARLQGAGLIDKHPQPGDRRLVALALTAAGRALHARLVPLALLVEARVLAALTPAERAQLVALVEQLIAALPAEQHSATNEPQLVPTRDLTTE